MRHKPKLIEPTPVVVEQRNLDGTVYNDRAREAVKQVARLEEIELEAQVSWGRSARVGFKGGGHGGVNEEASGYLVFRVEDLEEKGVTLSRGDRVKTIGGEPYDVYLTNKLMAGHHHGKAWLEIWDVSDYTPSKVKRA